MQDKKLHQVSIDGVSRTQTAEDKINTTVLPTATEEYEALQFDTLIRILEQITQQLNFGFQEDLKEEATRRTFFLG